MTLTSPLRIGISPCGCLHESRRRYRLLEVWRCELHSDRYRRAEAVWPLRRCESCRRRPARYRIVFGDGAAWVLCVGCEPGRRP